MSKSDSIPSTPAAIAVFGGSFDPVHVGHLWIAESALTQLPVDHVRWFPAATSPLKPNGPIASSDTRLRMLQLALAGQPGHVVDDFELRREGVSYTVKTLKHLNERFPETKVFLVIGSDSLATFAAWHEPAEVLRRCTLAVIARGGQAAADYDVLKPYTTAETIAEIRRHEIRMPLIEISSSDLRQRIANGQSIRFRVPHAVAAMIQAESIYR